MHTKTKLILAYMAGLVVLFLLGSCASTEKLDKRAEKRVMNSVNSFERVGKKYIELNGSVVDTTRNEYTAGTPVYIKGKDSIVYRRVVDTVREPVPCDEFEKTTAAGTKVKVDKQGNLTLSRDSALLERYRTDSILRTDSLRTLLFDRTRFDVCKDSLDHYRALAASNATEIKQLKRDVKQERRQITFMWIGFGLLVALAVFLKVKRIV